MEPERTSDESYTQLLKILLLGDSASKKQILLKKFLGDETANDVTLLGLDYKLKDVVFNGKKLKLQIWDTAGQERFRSVTASYYRGSNGALLVCSVFETPSFLNLQYWLEEIKNYTSPHFHVVLVAVVAGEGLEGAEAITLDTVRGFAEDKKLQLVECNLQQPDDVNRAFMMLVQGIMGNNSVPGPAEDSVVLQPSTTSTPCSC